MLDVRWVKINIDGLLEVVWVTMLVVTFLEEVMVNRLIIFPLVFVLKIFLYRSNGCYFGYWDLVDLWLQVCVVIMWFLFGLSSFFLSSINSLGFKDRWRKCIKSYDDM